MNPYKDLPETNFWRKAISSKIKFEVDPVISTKFKINKKHKICTAGSCFAQNLAIALKREGYNYHVTEQPPSSLTSEQIKKYNYGIFSARYGNIYTTVQLNEIFKEAIGDLPLNEIAWEAKDEKALIDPLRPNLGESFKQIESLIQSREDHIACVKKIIEESDIFVFTLGLTESWFSKKMNRTLPMAPGVYNLEDSLEEYEFKNLSYNSCLSALEESIEILKKINPRIKIILTVSPVPLIATYENKHVLVSNTYSKSQLRVVASDAADKYGFVDYFPSYEIITGAYTYSSYFKNDLREVEEIGIKHVMEIFLKHYSLEINEDSYVDPSRDEITKFEDSSDIICDEEEIDRL